MNTASSVIMHLDLDCFFVSVSRLMNPALVGKPVLIGSQGERGVVAACSYEARRYGIHSAMPMKWARRLCPEAYVVQGDYELYARKSDEVTDIIRSYVPVYEKASIDEFYLDLTGMDRFFGCYRWAHDLWKKIRSETGLSSSFGLAINKTVSKIATDVAKPNGSRQVEQNTERAFLAPLSIKRIPMVGDKTYALLRQMGVEKIGTLQQMPLCLLEELLGENGRILWQRAQGIDPTPVRPYTEAKSVSAEHTLDQDTTDMQQLEQILVRMSEQLLFRLRSKQQCASTVVVKIRYSNFDTHTLQKHIAYTACDHRVVPVVRALFHRLYQRRLSVRLVGVRFAGLIHGGQQLSLFEENQQHLCLYHTLDRLRQRYGMHIIGRAATLPAGSCRPHRSGRELSAFSSSLKC